jgi:hypothetical protein
MRINKNYCLKGAADILRLQDEKGVARIADAKQRRHQQILPIISRKSSQTDIDRGFSVYPDQTFLDEQPITKASKPETNAK